MKNLFTGAAIAALSLVAVACTSTPPVQEAAPAAAAAPAEDHSEHTMLARVFFVSPKDGETIKNGSKAVFGAEMFTIAAVPEGTVTDVRANTGHFHLGFDTECLPAGSVIPKADPWVHFGKGTDNIELNLTPGPHTLTVEAGDDKHTTMSGLCETIKITVAP